MFQDCCPHLEIQQVFPTQFAAFFPCPKSILTAEDSQVCQILHILSVYMKIAFPCRNIGPSLPYIVHIFFWIPQ